MLLMLIFALNSLFAQPPFENAPGLPHLEGPYLGQKPPGSFPELFAPGIVSTEAFEYTITFTPEMEELFFTRRRPEADNEIYTMKRVDGRWTKPEVVIFAAGEGWDFEPHIGPKGNRLYFGSTRPLPHAAGKTGLHQWYCNKTEDGWTNPLPMEGLFIEQFVMYLTASRKGNLFFTSGIIEAGKLREEGIYYSMPEGGSHNRIRKMGKAVNRADLEAIAHPFIAPDESYMLFDGKGPSGFGDCDLYISFNENGTWTEAVNLGPLVNTAMCEMTASVSPDGKYLFFHRGLVHEGTEIGSIYWVDFLWIKEQSRKMKSP